MISLHIHPLTRRVRQAWPACSNALVILGMAAWVSPLGAQDIPSGSAPGQSVPVQQYRKLADDLKTAQTERDSLKKLLVDKTNELRKAQLQAAEARKAQQNSEAEVQQIRNRSDTASPTQLQAVQQQVQKLKTELAQAKRNASTQNTDLSDLRRNLDLAEKNLEISWNQIAQLQQNLIVGGQDLVELIIPRCGNNCPSFIIIPTLAPVKLGSGTETLQIDIRHRYALGKTEVTVWQWKLFWNSLDRDYDPSGTSCWQNFAEDDRLPVACINVLDAEAYVRWINKKYAKGTGMTFDLPTEVEWEFGARGGRYSQEYLWESSAGETEKCQYANTWICSERSSIAVGSKQKNGYDLFDMIGNVWEWQSSPWRGKRGDLPANGLETEPAGVSALRSVRGASSSEMSLHRLNLTNRISLSPSDRYRDVGFRLVARLASR